MTILSQKKITRQQFEKAHKFLVFFVSGIQLFYGEKFITPKIHALLHVKIFIEKWGPLFTHSMFPFESMNCLLVRQIHSRRHRAVIPQIIWITGLRNFYLCIKKKIIELLRQKNSEQLNPQNIPNEENGDAEEMN